MCDFRNSSSEAERGETLESSRDLEQYSLTLRGCYSIVTAAFFVPRVEDSSHRSRWMRSDTTVAAYTAICEHEAGLSG